MAAVRTSLAAVVVSLLMAAQAALSACPHADHGLARWSQPSTWPGGKKPGLHSHVTIDKGVLLDETPPELWGVTVEAGGRLVWGADGDHNLTTTYILIHGRLDIGSEDCPFPRQARITLTGTRGQYRVKVGSHHYFNEKFVGVAPGGTLELHGQNKLSWTKLTRTLPKLRSDTGLQYDHLSTPQRTSTFWKKGLAAYVLDSKTGAVLNFSHVTVQGDAWSAEHEPPQLVQLLDDAPAGSVVLVAVSNNLYDAKATQLPHLYDAIERTAFGKVTGSSLVRHVRNGDAYVMATQKGVYESTVESRGENFGLEEQEAYARVVVGGHKFSALSYVNNKRSWENHINFRVISLHGAFPVLNVLDDVTSWKAGDQLLLTSTDYNWKEAETVRVVDCPGCNNKQIQVEGEIAYEHYGEITDGVDMRGEVALLSRNIVIEGRMENTCPSSNGNCKDFPFDTFGGHLKAVRGFKDVHIEGVEFVHMGQQTEVGHYPVHFHMCEDVDSQGNYSHPPYVRDNSIHHAFSRCVTIHGTHGVTVMDNVAYRTLGHCYFLEDGGEKRTVLDGNLGVGTVQGKILPSDSQPATFWITNPLTYVRNNVAAGGEHAGLWYVFPTEPYGPSKGRGHMEKDEASHTAYLEFNNNVAHSYHTAGLFIDNHLEEDGSVANSNSYSPHENPKDLKSPDKAVDIYRLTAYKNGYQNAWIRGGLFHVSHASLSDSREGLTFARSSNQEQYLTESIIVGESANLGEPTQYGDSKTGYTMPRAIPLEYDMHTAITGFQFYDGPVYVRNVWFGGFRSNQNYSAGALAFLRENEFSSSAVSSVTNAKFQFADSASTGNRVYDGDASVHGFADKDGDKEATFRDLDGSVTGVKDATVIKPDPVFTTARCYKRDNWNMAVCPHKYGKLAMRLDSSEDHMKTMPIMTRDDVRGHDVMMTWKNAADFPVVLGGDHSYIIHWSDHVPRQFEVIGDGVEKDQWVRFGVCMPRDATFDLYSYYGPGYLPDMGHWKAVGSVQELEHNTTGGFYFWDKGVGLLSFKFQHPDPRSANESDGCPGDRCPMVRITLKSGNSHDADCTSRAYGPYRRSPIDGSHALHHVALPATAPSPPHGWGAGATRPFLTRIPVDGHYGPWGSWGACSQTCGGGTQIRTRNCDSPMPQNGGKDCDGPRVEQQGCNSQPCAVDGGWSAWGAWGACTKVSGCHGYQKRTRNCNSPAPQHDGVYCEGYDEEVRSCTAC